MSKNQYSHFKQASQFREILITLGIKLEFRISWDILEYLYSLLKHSPRAAWISYGL